MHMGMQQQQQQQNQGMPGVVDYNSDLEESFYNIDENNLNEGQDMRTAREQVIKTFKPGGTSMTSKVVSNHLPECPGFGKVELWRKNKASKRRVKVDPNKSIKKMEDYHFSDIGGDGGD